MKKLIAAIRAFPCRAWHFLTSSRYLWWTLCALLFGIWAVLHYFKTPIISTIMPEEVYASLGIMLSDNVIREEALGYVAGFIGIAGTFALFVVPRRKAVLKALADGFFNNFIKRVVPPLRNDNKKLLIMKPEYDVFDIEDYEGNVAKELRSHNLYVDTGSKIGTGRNTRTLWLIKQNEGTNPSVYFDLGRNLTVLKDLTDREMEFPAIVNKTLCRKETKYICLRNSYFKTLSNLYSNKYEPQVIFIDGKDMKVVADALIANMA